eukprot:1073535-Pelagomonas_calceolata.AAC.1
MEGVRPGKGVTFPRKGSPLCGTARGNMSETYGWSWNKVCQCKGSIIRRSSADSNDTKCLLYILNVLRVQNAQEATRIVPVKKEQSNFEVQASTGFEHNSLLSL